MAQTCCITSTPALWGSILALLALVAGAAPPTTPSADPPAARATRVETDADEPQRKAEVLAGSRWRRAMHELDEWLTAQPVYSPDRVQRIKADLATRTAGMTSYELEYMLEGLDDKLHILESP